MQENEIARQKILAFDIGTKRIGLAVWNPESRLVTPLPLRERKTLKEDLRFFEEIIRSHAIERLLVGIPYTLAGKETASTKNAEFWRDLLKKSFSLPVETQDESLSTQEADKILKQSPKSKRKLKRDSVAAALILKEFLNVE